MSHEASAAEAAKEPVTLDERLSLAYRGAVPAGIAQFFAWELTSRAITVDQTYQAGEQVKAIARSINAREEVERERPPQAQHYLVDLEKKLLALKSEYLSLCNYCETNPPVTASALDVGMMYVKKTGAEKLLPVLERAVEDARLLPAKAERDARNWKVLADLADVIAGITRPSDILAHKLGLYGAWQICPPLLRAARERERREAAEQARTAPTQREIERQEAVKKAEEAAKAFKARQAAIAEVDGLDFHGLIGFVFNGRREALEGMPTLQSVIAAWPDRPEPHTSQAAIAELRKIGESNDLLFSRAVNRLASVIYS
jgi:hypothetical protein